MPFPPAPRVIYEINPLDEVVCQLRFPPILKIDAEPPAAFQELIRADYPTYEHKSAVKLPPGLPPNLVADFPLSGPKTHVFGTRDDVWRLSLTRQTIALTCGDYKQWERFKERLTGPFDALKRSYAPAYFSRIGLRYRDVFRPSDLGLQGVPWGELLQPWLCGVLGAGGVAQDTYGTETVCGINLPDGLGRVQLRFGLAIEARRADNEEQEEVFLIDSDFFTDQETEPPHVIDRLDAFHEQAGRLFHWCITERLHAALRPGPVPPG